MSSKMQMPIDAFGNGVQELLRTSGYSQKELAEELHINPKVLSRKLNGYGNSHLTHIEIRNILLTLTRWHAITTQNEAVHLLELAEVGSTLFDEEEWLAPPLKQLQAGYISPALIDTSDIPLDSFKHNLPSSNTRFIGREWAVERLRYLFKQGDIRLVTLVGLGGSGKTRIALHVARDLLNTFEHGVWFVSLAGIIDPTLVPMTIIQALNIKVTPGVPIMQSLCAYLRNKHLLLVLDNFEHVKEAANIVDELLMAAPGIKVLVTSRAVLHLYGEHALGIPTLDIPDPNFALHATDLAHYEAIQLFVERVQSVMPDFALTEENKAVIAQICAKVDGLPLALELAAARVRVLSPDMLLERLSNTRLSILVGGAKNLPSRHQTLRNTIIWSYNLLSSYEQIWFPRLGIFSGGWSLDAVEAMMQDTTAQEQVSDASSMLDVIEQLVDNSLLVRMPDKNRQPRFTMLQTLREYARERLATMGEVERWQDWHACYYLQIAEEAELGLRGPQQLVWLERLAIERDNFRAALEWLLQRARLGKSISELAFAKQSEVTERRDVAGSSTLSTHTSPGVGRSALEVCLRLASALRPYWEWQGYLTEGRHWLREALAIPFENAHEETIRAARAKALSEMSRLLCLQDEQGEAVELIEESLALWRSLDDPVGIATALLHRGWVAQAVSNNEEAKLIYKEGFQQLVNTNERWLRAQLLCYQGAAAGFTFDFERMRYFYEQGKKLFEQLGDKCALADFLKDQGGMLILDSNYNEAVACLLQSISLCKALDQKQYITTGMGWLAIAIGMRGEPDPETASINSAKLKGALQSLMDSVGITPWTRTHPMIQAINLHLRSRIDEQSWETAWNEGRNLSIEQAIDLAFRLGEEEV